MPKRKLVVDTLYAGHLDQFTKDGKYAGRFPTSFVHRDAAAKEVGTVVDPYSNISKNRFEDTFRADSTARNALLMLVKIVLGKKHECVMEPTQQYASDELRKQAVEEVMSKQEHQNMIAEMKEVEEKCKFHERLIASETQKHAFGRSALGVVIKEGMPSDLKVFASKNLGQVYLTKDWQFDGVDYQDALVEKQRFMPKDIMYFTNLDYHITPNTLFYGLSTLEGVAHASETKRIIIEEDLKETAKGSWAGVGLVKGAGIATQADADRITNAFDPGRWNFVNQDITAETFKIDSKPAELADLIEKFDRYIIRGIGVPLPVMGFEDVTNRATMQEVMQVYKETTVEFARSMLQSQIDAQWYDTLIFAITKKDPEEMEYRVRLEFEDLVFDTMKDKASAIMLLEQAGVPLPLEQKLAWLGLDNIADQVQELLDQKKKEEKEMMGMQQEQKAKGGFGK